MHGYRRLARLQQHAHLAAAVAQPHTLLTNDVQPDPFTATHYSPMASSQTIPQPHTLLTIGVKPDQPTATHYSPMASSQTSPKPHTLLTIGVKPDQPTATHYLPMASSQTGWLRSRPGQGTSVKYCAPRPPPRALRLPQA